MHFTVVFSKGAKVRKTQTIEKDDPDNVVCTLNKGDVVEVAEIVENRARIIEPVKGWVSITNKSGEVILQRKSARTKAYRASKKPSASMNKKQHKRIIKIVEDAEKQRVVKESPFKEVYENHKKAGGYMKYYDYIKVLMDQRGGHAAMCINDLIGLRIECRGSTGLLHYWGIIKDLNLRHGDFILTNTLSTPNDAFSADDLNPDGTLKGCHYKDGDAKAIRLCWFENTRKEGVVQQLKQLIQEYKDGKIDADAFKFRKTLLLFNKLDMDGDGELTPDELAKASKEERDMLLKADYDGDGTITKEELRKYKEELEGGGEELETKQDATS